MELVVIILVSYLIGSFPTAYLVGKIFFGFDIRTKGSGNMGSTNVFRVIGTKWGIVVQIVDIAKGFVPTFLLAPWLAQKGGVSFLSFEGNVVVWQIIAGFCAVVGHVWSVFVGFRGGKGINTALGMMLGIAPLEVALALIVFLLVLFSTGFVSLGSISAAFAIPVVCLVRKYIFDFQYPNFPILISFTILLSIFIVYTHRENIKRMLLGKENRFEKLIVFKSKKRS